MTACFYNVICGASNGRESRDGRMGSNYMMGHQTEWWPLCRGNIYHPKQDMFEGENGLFIIIPSGLEYSQLR